MKIHCRYDALVDVHSLLPYPKNRNKHPDDQIERLAKLIEYQGLRAPIVVDAGDKQTIVKGHGTLSALKKLDCKRIPVVYQEFESEEQRYAFVQSDNAIASWSEFDFAGVNIDLPELGPDFDIDLLGIKDFVLEPADKYGDKDADATPEVRQTSIRLGDLFQLGSHKLLCGDSTDATQVERLMNGEKADMVFTDPPYGISLDVDYADRYGNEKNRNYKTKIDGDYGKDAGIDLRKIIEQSNDAKNLFIWGAENYPDCLPRGGTWTVWDKSVEAVDGIASDFELCWSRERHHYSMIRKLWKGAKAREETGQEGAHRTRWGHPTQKPIELALFFFETWGKKDKIVLDFFLGSGTTLIACEKTNRKCYGMEIDPVYCQVIIDRYKKFTGRDDVVKL